MAVLIRWVLGALGLVSLLLVWLALSPQFPVRDAVPVSAPPSSLPNIYSKPGWFSVHYPDGWTVRSEGFQDPHPIIGLDLGFISNLSAEQAARSPYSLDELQVHFFGFQTDVAFDDWIRRQVAQAVQTSGGRRVSRDESILADKQAVRWTTSATSPVGRQGPGLTVVSYYVKHPKGILEIRGSMLTANSQSLTAAFEEIVRTLQTP